MSASGVDQWRALGPVQRCLLAVASSVLIAAIGAASLLGAPSSGLGRDAPRSVTMSPAPTSPVTFDDARLDAVDGDVAVAPPPATFDAPLPAAAPPVVVHAPAHKADGVFAVVIGIDDYPGRNGDLRSAVNDARDVDAALAGFGVPAERRLLLLDGAANQSAVNGAADWLVANAGPDATAVFFYAGHVRKLGAGREAIVAGDGREVTDRALAGRLDGLEAGRTWVVIAGCYGGGFDEVLRPGRILTAASDANHLAYENSDFGRSYLVEYLVRRGLLQGGSVPTVQDAFAYATAELSRDFPNRLPFQIDHLGSPLRFAPGGATAPPALEPEPLPPPDGSAGSGGGAGTDPPAAPPPPAPPGDGEGRDEDGSTTSECLIAGPLVKACK